MCIDICAHTQSYLLSLEICHNPTCLGHEMKNKLTTVGMIFESCSQKMRRARTHTYTHTHTHTRTRTRTCVCVYIHKHAYTHPCIPVSTNTRTCILTNPHRRVYVHKSTGVCTKTHAFTYFNELRTCCDCTNKNNKTHSSAKIPIYGFGLFGFWFHYFQWHINLWGLFRPNPSL